MKWDVLLDEKMLANVLPPEYAHFARPLQSGLVVFLQSLPAADQLALLQAQAALPPTASVSLRLATLARRCPVLQKLGQVLARDPRLSAELRAHLRELESLPPTVPLATIQETLHRELGPLERLGLTLSPPAIAEASVAVVIPFREPATNSPQSSVFKILKPGIEERLERELAALERVGAHLDEHCQALGLPLLDYEAAFQQVREKLAQEVHLDQEQQHLAQARACYADEPQVQIPRLLAYCTRRVTAMERVHGCKVTEHAWQDRRDRHRLASLVSRALLARPMFSPSRQALFHGDPHAGNLLLTEDQRLAILDWSLVGSLGHAERAALAQLMLGAWTLRGDRVVALLVQLDNGNAADRSALREVVRTGFRRLRQGEFPGFTWLVGLLDDAVQRARLRFAKDLMLFRKSWHTLEGVVADVGADRFRLDQVLALEFVKHFLSECPQRWVAWPHSREYATRLSNLDLARAFWSAPTTASRFWQGQMADCLEFFIKGSVG